MAQTVACCVLLATHPPFLSPNLFAVKTEGLLHPLRFASHSYRPLSKVRCCRPKNSGGYRRDCNTNLALHPTLPKLHYPTHLSCCECDSPTFHKNKIRPRFHGGELIRISLSGVWGVAPMWVVGHWCRCVVQRLCATDYKRPCLVSPTAPLPTKIKSAPVFTGANSSSH